MAQKNNEIMQAYSVVFDSLAHLGPGDSATTRGVLERLFPNLPANPRVADFGCGVGASSLVLAQTLPEARVLALDFHAPFIARLESTAKASELGERISARVGDMLDPPPLDGLMGEFDLIWSESAIYSIGRSTAFNHWRPLLKPGGWLVFSDVVWHCEPANKSSDVSAFWTKEYPDISTIEAILEEITAAGFYPLDPVLSSRQAWSNYYEPLRDRLRLLKKRKNSPRALIDLMDELEREIEIYDGAGDEVVPCFFLARREPIAE